MSEPAGKPDAGHMYAAQALRVADLLERLASQFDQTAELAATHAARPSPPVDDETRETELERSRRAHAHADRARANASRLRQRAASSALDTA